MRLAAHAGDARGMEGLRTAGKLRADVARAEHGDPRAMQRADTAGERFPAARADDLGILHLAAQQHQADHDEMLGDGGAVGAGGVGEPTVGILVQALVADHSVHFLFADASNSNAERIRMDNTQYNTLYTNIRIKSKPTRMTHQTSNPETHSLPAPFAPVFQLLSAVHCSVPVTKIKKVHASVSLQTHGRIHCHS